MTQVIAWILLIGALYGFLSFIGDLVKSAKSVRRAWRDWRPQ